MHHLLLCLCLQIQCTLQLCNLLGWIQGNVSVDKTASTPSTNTTETEGDGAAANDVAENIKTLQQMGFQGCYGRSLQKNLPAALYLDAWSCMLSPC